MRPSLSEARIFLKVGRLPLLDLSLAQYGEPNLRHAPARGVFLRAILRGAPRIFTAPARRGVQASALPPHTPRHPMAIACGLQSLLQLRKQSHRDASKKNKNRQIFFSSLGSILWTSGHPWCPAIIRKPRRGIRILAAPLPIRRR